MNWKENTLQTKNIRIQITNRHVENPGVWVCHVRELDWRCKPLGIPNGDSEQDAKAAAVLMVKHHLHTMIAELS